MSCEYTLFGKTYSEEEFRKLLQDPVIQKKIKSYEESYDPDEIELSDSEPKETILSEFKKLTQYKQSLISKLKNRVAGLKSIIKDSNDKDFIIEKTKLQQEMENRIANLQNEIENITSNSGVTLQELKWQSQQDLKRVQRLLSSGSMEDAAEAKRIINWYLAMELNTNKTTVDKEMITEHPFFQPEEIFDENGDLILDDDVVDLMTSMANSFKEEANKLEGLERNLIEEIMNTNPKIKQMYDKLSYDEITKDLPDLSWVDMMIMDITQGIFSKNGLLPQVMMDVTQSTFAEKISGVKRFEERHNTLLPKVEQELKNLGYGISKLGILGVKGVSFDLFFQKGLGDNKTGRLVHRYNQDFFDERSMIMTDFKNLINAAKKEEDPEKKKELFKKAFNQKQQWFRENTIVFNINTLPEIAETFPELGLEVDESHKQEILNEIDEIGYKEEIEKQIKEIKKYKAWAEAYEQTFLTNQGVLSKEELTEDMKLALERDIAKQNPFLAANYFYTNAPIKAGEQFVTPSMNFNISIPRKNKVIDKYNETTKRFDFEKTNVETGFYDKNYEKIENNSVLKEYYDLIKTQLDQIQKSFPQEVQEELLVNYLPSVRKSLMESIADSDVGFFRALWDIVLELYDRIRLGFGINKEDQISYENTDVVSGKPEYEVNRSFITNNKGKIKSRFKIESKYFQNILSKNGTKRKIYGSTVMNLKDIPSEGLSLLAQRSGMSVSELQQKYSTRVPVGNILYQDATNQVVKDYSTNLPKIIKYYSMMAAEYEARNQLLPYIQLMKQHYKQIQSTATNNAGQSIINQFTGKKKVDGSRSRANTQVDSWFDRVILGNYGEKQFGVIESEVGNQKKTAKDKIKSFVSGKILSLKEQKTKKQLDELIEKETDDKEKKKLIDMRNKLGKDFALSATIDNFLNYIRFLGLGYNLSSGVTNFMEGQSANIILAASGDYFKPEHFHRANGIMWGSFLKNTSFGKVVTPGAKKARSLMDRFDILEDTANELQKASTKTALNQFKNLHPMEINKRIEYLNQTPVMISILLNTEIKDSKGNISNVWDAMNPDGSLKEEFRTDENIQAWEDNEGETFTTFKTKVNKAILVAHGNYDQLRGMFSKTNVVGKALMMFKTWVGSALYGRFAVKQEDIELGDTEYKGRYWSHTSSSGLLQGAIAGFAIAGTGGLALGAGIGLGAGSLFGVKSNMNLLKEMAFLVKATIRKSIASPINMISGKERLKEIDNFDQLKGDNFTDRDVKNMKANIADMSILLSWVALTLLTKAMFWDDDDEEDDARRIAHNLFANRFLQLASQGTAYVYPPDLYENLVGNVAIMRWANDVNKSAQAFGEYLEGNDIITSGTNAGDSRLYNSTSKLMLPSLIRDKNPLSLGFGTQAQRQFTKTPYDDWFWSDKKKRKRIIKGQKARFKQALLDEGYPEKIANKIVKRKYPS